MASGAPYDLLRVEGLAKRFASRGTSDRRTEAAVYAVRDVAFSVARGETLGLVGESGSGKSTTARLVLRLIEPTYGSVWFDGLDVFRLPAQGLRRLRRRMQLVFQDPYGSLDPKLRVHEAISEPLDIHHINCRAWRRQRVSKLLELVGLDDTYACRLPKELSGGQLQRVGIARALSLEPALLILDEPTSALDASVQGQIIGLLRQLQTQLGLSYLFISHDLALVRQMSDRIAVMFRGRIVEVAPAKTIFEAARHPYTQSLLAVARALEARMVPTYEAQLCSAVDPHVQLGSGCPYRSQCSLARTVESDYCSNSVPELRSLADGHRVACHFADHRGRQSYS